jgi:hypothetical protein
MKVSAVFSGLQTCPLALSACFVALKAGHGEQYEGDDKHSSTNDINGGGAGNPPKKIVDKPW